MIFPNHNYEIFNTKKHIKTLAALQPVGAKNNTGPFPDPIRALQTGDALVIVYVFLCHIFPPAYTEPFVF